MGVMPFWLYSFCLKMIRTLCSLQNNLSHHRNITLCYVCKNTKQEMFVKKNYLTGFVQLVLLSQQETNASKNVVGNYGQVIVQSGVLASLLSNVCRRLNRDAVIIAWIHIKDISCALCSSTPPLRNSYKRPSANMVVTSLSTNWTLLCL